MKEKKRRKRKTERETDRNGRKSVRKDKKREYGENRLVSAGDGRRGSYLGVNMKSLYPT
jgi:hypothetical protein